MRRALAALAFVLAAAPARANPLDTFGFGSRGTAMGDAQVADSADFSANYYNPAGLARARGFEIAVGYFRATHELETNGKNNAVDPVAGLVGGLVLPGRLFHVPIAFGLGLHVPDDRLSRVRDLPQTQPRWELYDNRNQRLYLAANLAFEPWPWLDIGGGLSFMASTEGTLDISGEANLFNLYQSQLRHQVDASLGAIRYPQVGARVALGKRAALGVIYRGAFALHLDLSANLYGSLSNLTTALYTLQTDSVDAYLPQQVVFGGSFQPRRPPQGRRRLHVGQLERVHHARREPRRRAEHPAARGWMARRAHAAHGAGEDPGRAARHERSHRAPRRRRVARVRSRQRRRLRARSATRSRSRPIGPQTGITNYVDRDRHTIALGFGVDVDKPVSILPGDLRFDVHAQFAILPTSVTTKSDPADLVGDYAAGGFIWNLGATMIAGFK